MRRGGLDQQLAPFSSIFRRQPEATPRHALALIPGQSNLTMRVIARYCAGNTKACGEPNTRIFGHRQSALRQRSPFAHYFPALTANSFVDVHSSLAA